MNNRSIMLVVITLLSVMVLVFFYLRNQPVERKKNNSEQASIIAITQPTVTFVNPSRGPKDAKVTLFVFSDFQCGACKQLNPIFDIVLKTFPDDVRLVWKNMPNTSTHPQAMGAAVAAHCADKQGKFWEYHRALFERQAFLANTQFEQIAADINLDTTKFSNCFNEKVTQPIVQKDFDEGVALGIIATPTIFIGEKSFVGLQSAEILIKAIKEVLKTYVPNN